jgi:hypothetical protein
MVKQAILIGLMAFFPWGVFAETTVPVPRLIAPDAGGKAVVFHPSFSWELASRDDLSVQIQIASDKDFSVIADTDQIHSIADWYVPAQRLVPGTYWWRVRGKTDSGEIGEWSAACHFSVVAPEKTFVISAQTSLAGMREIALKAAQQKSALIRRTAGMKPRGRDTKTF